MKAVTIVVTGVLFSLAVAGLGAWFFFRVLGTVTAPADTFFAYVAADDRPAWRELMSSQARHNMPVADMENWLQRQGLDSVVDTRWTYRAINGDLASLRGTAVNAVNASIPLEVSLVREEGSWRLHTIEVHAGGVSGGRATPPVPDQTRAAEMVQASMQDFLDSLRQGSLADFHAGLGRSWRSGVSVEALNADFAPFLELADAMQALRTMEFEVTDVLRPARAHVVTIQGHYPTAPNRLYVEASYEPEGERFALIGWHLDLRP